ncbi:hypothetical protein Tco_0079238 [Tanacetum coccineum]
MVEDDYMPKYIIDPSNLHLKEYFRNEAGKKNLFSIKLHHGEKFTASPKRMYNGGKVNYVDNIDVDRAVSWILVALCYNCDVDHNYLSPFKPSVEIEELDDDVELNASVVESSKRLALGWINEDDVGASSVDKNDNMIVDLNVNEEQTNENVNADDEQDSSEENKQDISEDKHGRGDDTEDFVVDEEHVIDEVEVNMEGFCFSVEEQGADPDVTPNVDLTDEALELLDFNSFDSDVGDDTASIRRSNLRKLKKIGGQSCGIVNTLFVRQEFPNKELAKAIIKAHEVKTRKKIGIVKNDNGRVQAK